jgi:hypothetical protein
MTKKIRRSRAKKLKTNINDVWKQIVSDVEKSDVPIKVLNKLVIHLTNGAIVEVNIKELMAGGADPFMIEDHLNQRLKDLSDIISDIEYYIDIESVVQVVQPETDKILKNI